MGLVPLGGPEMALWVASMLRGFKGLTGIKVISHVMDAVRKDTINLNVQRLQSGWPVAIGSTKPSKKFRRTGQINGINLNKMRINFNNMC